MANITGKLVFDKNRNGQEDSGTDVGLANVPVVLQDTATNSLLAVNTTATGGFEFQNVNDGTYRLVVVGDYAGSAETSPADFTNATAGQEAQQANLPAYTVVPEGNRVAGMNALNAVTPTTETVTVASNQNVTAPTFFIGPVDNKALTIDPAITLDNTNLITNADNGTFGEVAQGSQPNSGPAANPYAAQNLTNDFTFVQENATIGDGNFTIGNTLNPTGGANWWRLSDHTTAIETGMMEIGNGTTDNKNFFTTTVNVKPNTNYILTAWVANLDKTTTETPNAGIIVNGADGSALAQNLANPLSTSTDLPEWTQIGIPFNSGDNSSVTLNLVNVGNTNTDNAFAADDIELREATLPFTVTKSVNPTSAGLDDTVTYTVVLNNTSANTLSNATFVDRLPAGLEYVPNTLSVNGQAKAGADPNTQFTIDDITGNGNATVTFDAKVVSLPATPRTDNTAQFGFSYTPISGGQAQTLNLSSTEANPLYIGDAVIGSTNFTKTSGTQSAKVGDEIPYTIAISNGGNVNATDVTLTDALPTGTTLVADSLTVINKQTGANVDYTGDLASGLNLTNAIVPGTANEVDVSYRALVNTAPVGNTLTNTANLSYQYQRNPNDPTTVTQTGTASADVNIEDTADYPITITKTANPANNLVVGEVITYTITVENTSTNNATYTNATITDTLPANLTYERGSVTINGQTSTQELTNGITLENALAANTPTTVTFRAAVNSIPENKTISNTASINYDATVGGETRQQDITATSEATTSTVVNASLAVTKTDNAASTLAVGDTFNYTIAVNNNGEEALNNITVTDNLPSQLEVTQISVDGTPIDTLLTNSIPVGTINVGETKTVVISVRAASGGLTNFQNTALAATEFTPAGRAEPVEISVTGTDNNAITIPTNPTPTPIIPATPIYDLNRICIISQVNKNAVCVGDTITYTTTVSNVGSVAIGTYDAPVTVFTSLSPAVSFIPGSLMINNTQMNVSNPYAINLGILQPGEVRIITFSVRVCNCYPTVIYNMQKVVYGYDPLYIGASTYTANSNIVMTYVY